ncbi:MAG TPA: hypothetical protein VLO10_00045, partial [Candidatus Deferrimicrobium sp.]|nr:hypothetical protein [Candidatus Deferrimicrobium sp.]
RGMCAIVHVHEHTTSPDADDAVYRRLAAELQCVLVERDGVDIAGALIAATRDRGARHLVIGEPKATGLVGSLRPSIVDRVVESLTDVDVHVIGRHGITATAGAGRPDPDTLLNRLYGGGHPVGGLRLYIGYAPGVGTTTAMLEEARRRASRGTDVVVASLPPAMLERLDALPLLGGRHAPAAQGRLDVEALLARNPEVAAVDDLAAPTTTGGIVAEAVRTIRAAGITVIGTIRMADLRSTAASLAALVDRDPGRPVVEDETVDAADELELVDIVPAELEERLRDGLIMRPRDTAHALQSSFRPTVLATLRELTFRRVAQHTDRRLIRYMTAERIASPWEARPRVLVCVPPLPGQETLIASAARFAARRDDALTAISVRSKRRTDEEKQMLGGYAAMTHQLGGEFVTVHSGDIAATIAAYARDHRITEIVLRRTPGHRQSRTLRRLVRLVVDIDVHILASDR